MQKRNVPSLRLSIQGAELDRILSDMRAVFGSGQFTLGAHGKSFEEEFAAFVGAPYACAVNSGTSALEIALRAFGVAGKEVLVPSNTFFATVAAVLHAGGEPRFVDCDPRTLAMDYRSLVERSTPRCAGVIVVHIGGPVTPCIKEVQDFCHTRGLFLLEDAAHAHGSSLAGRHPGAWGAAAAFSFYPTKVMTSGEGGMLVTRDERIYKEALMYRDQGKESFSSNFHVRLGYNWRMSEFHAVLGRSQLRELPMHIDERREIASWYDSWLRDVPNLSPQWLPEGSASNYYKYPIMLPNGIDRAALKKRMKAEWGVSLSGEVYDLPCHQQPVFKAYADRALPGAEEACARHICLPLFPGLTKSEAEYVVEALRESITSLHPKVSGLRIGL